MHDTGKAVGAVTLQIEQELVTAAIENIVVCVPRIPLTLAGVGLQGVDLVCQRIIKKELRSKLAVLAIGAPGAYRKVDV